MKQPLTGFIMNLIIFSIILGGATHFALTLFPEQFQISTTPFIFVFFFSVTLIVHLVLMKAAEKSFNKFLPRFMGATFVKLMFYLVVLVTYVFFHHSEAVTFILIFGIAYLLYTAFEVIAILRYFKIREQAKM